jgi:hypothetical protein
MHNCVENYKGEQVKKNKLSPALILAGYRKRNTFQKKYFFGYKIKEISVLSCPYKIYTGSKCLGDMTMINLFTTDKYLMDADSAGEIKHIHWDLTTLLKYFYKEITHINNEIGIYEFGDTIFIKGVLGVKSKLLHSNIMCSLSPYLVNPVVSSNKILRQIETEIGVSGYKFLEQMLRAHPYGMFLPIRNDVGVKYVLGLTNINTTQLLKDETYTIMRKQDPVFGNITTVDISE